MAMREVSDRVLLRLNPLQEFKATLPMYFIEDELDCNRILESWKNLSTATNLLIRKQRRVGNRHTKKAVFRSRMEIICNDFSRRTENVKINFIVRENANHGVTDMYSLDVFKLSPIPESIRNAQQYCVAEVPSQHLYEEPELEYVCEEGQVQVQHQTGRAVGNHAANIATAPSEYLLNDANPPVVLVSEVTALPAAVNEERPRRSASTSRRVRFANAIEEPPLATPVTVLSPVNEQSSPLGRMQHLETIKAFLSESEYAAKRQEILDSI